VSRDANSHGQQHLPSFIHSCTRTAITNTRHLLFVLETLNCEWQSRHLVL
jgi:hypothetical protein